MSVHLTIMKGFDDMKIIFEILADNGSPIFNSIRDYSDDTPHSEIQIDFVEWKEDKMSQIESYWGPYGAERV